MEDFIKIIDWIKSEFSNNDIITRTEKDYIIMTIKNPNSDNNINVEFNSQTEEMILYFGNYHEHYNFNQEDFQTLIETIHKILTDYLVSISVKSGERWLYFTLDTYNDNSIKHHIESFFAKYDNLQIVVIAWSFSKTDTLQS